MSSTLDTREFQAGLQRLDVLLREAEQQADPANLVRFQQIVQGVLDLHRAGLERLLERVAESSETLLDTLGSDDLVSGLLLLHGLHPLDVEARVRQALEGVR